MKRALAFEWINEYDIILSHHVEYFCCSRLDCVLSIDHTYAETSTIVASLLTQRLHSMKPVSGECLAKASRESKHGIKRACMLLVVNGLCILES